MTTIDRVPTLRGTAPTDATPVRRPRRPGDRRWTGLGFPRRRVLQAVTAVGFAALGVFPAARKAYAEGYDIWTGACPSYADDHDCSPGCGPSTIFADACETEGANLGYHKNDGVQWTLRPNQCYSGGYDGWLWRYDGACGACSCHVERRCHDGYRSTGSGWVRSICRWNTDCGCPGSVDWPSVSRGASGPDVYAIQLLLGEHGHDVTPNGSYGRSTSTAVENFQQANGLQVNGSVTAPTWGLLVIGVRRDDTGRAVEAVQHELNKYGHALAVDGICGELTAGAIGDFQRQNGLTIDNVAGQNTWRTLAGGAT
ncbi:MAG TPA: peptidoglycan-binding protein [Actinopolymorphaceae bacterium]